MSLALATIKKAVQLIKNNLIQEIETGVYLVQASNGKDTYQLTIENDLVKCTCMGYRLRIPHDCYHSEAIRRLNK